MSMKPLSGYDIKKLFDMSAAYFWPSDQAQIYRTLKKLVKNGLVELKECKMGETVEKKVYAITGEGQKKYLTITSENSVEDFISRDAFLLQLFFCGALSAGEQLLFIEKQLTNIKTLTQKLEDEFSGNYTKFLETVKFSEDDRRVQSAVYTYKWGLVKCREYAKLLCEFKEELLNKKLNDDNKLED